MDKIKSPKVNWRRSGKIRSKTPFNKSMAIIQGWEADQEFDLTSRIALIIVKHSRQALELKTMWSILTIGRVCSLFPKIVSSFPHSLFIFHISKKVLSYHTLFSQNWQATEHQDQKKKRGIKSCEVLMTSHFFYVFYPVMWLRFSRIDALRFLNQVNRYRFRWGTRVQSSME